MSLIARSLKQPYSCISRLEPRLNLISHILQGEVGELLLRDSALSLFFGEALRLGGRVVSKAGDFGDFGV
jgi:hypothetical protein